MPWNEADRAKYDVTRERYSSGLSDAELALIFPLSASRQRRGGSPPNHARQGALGNVCFRPWRKPLDDQDGREAAEGAPSIRGRNATGSPPGSRVDSRRSAR